MADETPHLVGPPVSKMPEPPKVGSEKRWCSICADEIWLSKDGLKAVDKDGYKPVCVDCFLGLIKDDPDPDIVPLTDDAEGREVTRMVRSTVRAMREDSAGTSGRLRISKVDPLEELG